MEWLHFHTNSLFVILQFIMTHILPKHGYRGSTCSYHGYIALCHNEREHSVYIVFYVVYVDPYNPMLAWFL